VCEVTVHI